MNNTEDKVLQLVEKLVNAVGNDKVIDHLIMFEQELHITENILTIIVNSGTHPMPNNIMKGELFVASSGLIDFSSEELLKNNFFEILSRVAEKLKSKNWNKVYVVPFGPAVLSMAVKILVYRVCHLETIDFLHVGNGKHIEINLNFKKIITNI